MKTLKVALITGSSKGIGFEIANKFLAENYVVIINSRNLTDLKDLKNRINHKNLFYQAGDVTKKSDVKKIFSNILEKHKKLDVLVCNVGNGKAAPPGSEAPNEWKKAS